MVLLECLRGGSGSDMPGDRIDAVKINAFKKKTFETSFKENSTRKSIVLRLPTINLEEKLSYKDAHEYCKACVPRRVYELDENGQIATDEAGIEIQRLRQPVSYPPPPILQLHTYIYIFNIDKNLSNNIIILYTQYPTGRQRTT